MRGPPTAFAAPPHGGVEVVLVQPPHLRPPVGVRDAGVIRQSLRRLSFDSIGGGILLTSSWSIPLSMVSGRVLSLPSLCLPLPAAVIEVPSL